MSPRITTRHELTAADMLFIKHYIDCGGNAAEAWRRLRPKAMSRHAALNGHKAIKRIRGRVGDEAFWSYIGLSEGAIAKAIKDGLEAKMVKVFSRPEGLAYSEPLDDHQTRVSAAMAAARLRGLMRDKVEVSGDGENPVRIVLEGMTDEQLRAIAGTGSDRVGEKASG